MARSSATTRSHRALLRARDLGFVYPGHTLFAGLSFDIGPGLTLLLDDATPWLGPKDRDDLLQFLGSL